MQVAQAINYLESAAAIPASEMSPVMYTKLRACARMAAREYPVDADGAVGGYYDPEYTGARANVRAFRAAPVMAIPQSAKLQALIASKVSDPFAASLI